jgi:hypothetical protein
MNITNTVSNYEHVGKEGPIVFFVCIWWILSTAGWSLFFTPARIDTQLAPGNEWYKILLTFVHTSLIRFESTSKPHKKPGAQAVARCNIQNGSTR